MLTLMSVVLLAAANIPEMVISDDISDKDFISAIHAGFAASYSEAEKARELGSGQAEFATADEPKIYGTLTWVAWIDDQDVVNVAINGLVTERALGLVWAYTGADPTECGRKPAQWAAWRTYCVTDTAGKVWLRHETRMFTTTLKLGLASEGSLDERFKKLEQFGVCRLSR